MMMWERGGEKSWEVVVISVSEREDEGRQMMSTRRVLMEDAEEIFTCSGRLKFC